MKTNIIIALLSVMTTLQAVSLTNNKSEEKQQVNIPVAQEDAKCYITPEDAKRSRGFDPVKWTEDVINSDEAKGKKVILTYSNLFGMMMCMQ